MRPSAVKTSLLLPFTFFVLFAGNGFAQSKLVSLTKNWILEKTNVKGYYFEPEEQEKGDKLTLYPNYYFERVDQGKLYNGYWKLDCSQNRIILNYCGIDTQKALTIEKLENELLVLKLEEDWKMEMRIYLKAEMII